MRGRSPFRMALAVLAAIAACDASADAAPPEPDHVSLSQTTVSWSTVKYATDADNGFVAGSLDLGSIVDHRFTAYVLENRYLKVTLVPGFGGRILSMIYKPTGHEELYRTEVGVPYGMAAGNFYYDWLMVYGGIFPTFPDAEHGKTWLKPWAFKVVKESAEEVTVSMSLTDDFAYAAAPPKFRKGSTGIEATYFVTLRAERAALDARLVLKNPTERMIGYEYWTCTTLAPGSAPDHPRATAGAEIIAPVRAYATPAWSANIAEGDAPAGPGRYRFDKLRWFRNWPSMGIAYAAPDMQGGNFWGAINHDDEEGIFRIADNAVTRGLKMWTWGYPSFTHQSDPRQSPTEAQPYVELWAGVSDQFFHAAEFPAHSELAVAETYAPTVGLRNVTDANRDMLVDLSAGRESVNVAFVSLAPAGPLRVRLRRGEVVLFDQAVTADPNSGNHVAAADPVAAAGDRIRLSITAADGRELIAAETTMK